LTRTPVEHIIIEHSQTKAIVMTNLKLLNTRELWLLYNAILAGGAAGDEYAVMDEIRLREGW